MHCVQLTKKTNGILLAKIAMAALCAWPISSADAVTTSWNTDFSGGFSSPSNWDNGVPGIVDTAVFRRDLGSNYTVNFPSPHPAVGDPTHYVTDRLRIGLGAVSFTRTFGSTYTVATPVTTEAGRGIIMGEFSNDIATLNLLMPVSSFAATIGNAPGSRGTLNVSGSNFNITGDDAIDDELIVGNHGVGTLNVTSGAQVNLSGIQSNTVLGKYFESTGAVVVDGFGSSWMSGNLFLGGNGNPFSEGGTGTLSIQNGAVVTVNFGVVGRTGSGTVTVDGPGSTWNLPVGVIGEGGSGKLNIQNGGTVSGVARIGDQSGSSGTVTVAGPGSKWIGGLDVGGLAVDSAGRLSVENEGLVSTTGSRIRRTGIATITGEGSSWINSGSFTSLGNITIADGGSLSTDDFVAQGSVMIANGGSLLTTLDSEVIGSLTIVGGAVWSNGGNSRFGTAGSGNVGIVSGSGSKWTIGGTLDVGGIGAVSTLRIRNGGTVFSAGAAIAAAAGATTTVTVDGTESTWNNIGDFIIGANAPDGPLAKLIVSGGASVSTSNGIVLVERSGGIVGNSVVSATVISRGRIEPGFSSGNPEEVMAGALRINGTYLQTATGSLRIRMDGTTPGADFSQLQVSGAVGLSGNLTVLTADSFAPSMGDSFDILDWGSLTGTFSTVTLPVLASGLNWDTSQLYTAGVISVVGPPVLEADFDEDGDVDHDDLVQWQGDFGQNGLSDADDDGDSDGADFLVWQQHISGLAVPATTIPEPASSALALLILVGLTAHRTRSKPRLRP